MSKLDPALQLALAAWQAEHGDSRAERAPGNVISVKVTYHGDLQSLRAAGLEAGFDHNGIVSGLVALSDLERLAALPNVVRIAREPKPRAGLDGTLKEMRVPWKVPPTTPWPGKGAGVIVAVIDTGIDIFHESFRKPDGKTRILELWDQGATTGGSAPPAGFTSTRGRIYSENDINTALGGDPPFHSIDDDGHGTHCAGIAAGNGKQDDRCSFPGHYMGVAPEADIVVVKYLGVSNGSSREALHWCAQAGARHKDSSNRDKPVVISCSWGSAYGPHDGTGDGDQEIDEILAPATGPSPPPGIAIVWLAGNSGAEETHESGTVPLNGTVTVPFTVRQGSVEGDHLEIWYNGTSTLHIDLEAPPNQQLPGPLNTGDIAPGAPGSPYTIGRMTLAVSSDTAASAANNKKQISISISTPTGTSVRSGPWKMKLTEKAGVAATWDAWFAFDKPDAFPTFRMKGEPDGVPQRRRDHTIWEPGSSARVITVASYSDDNGKLASSSSWGPANQAGRPVGEVKPTVAAPGVDVAAPRSRNDPNRNSSCCDQLVIDKSGTSMAAPHVAGLVALMLQKNRTLTYVQIREILQKSARIDGIPAAETPPVWDVASGIRANTSWGSGKVDAAAALTATVAAGGGGGGGGTMTFDTDELGYTAPTFGSRLADWQRRFGARPGLMLFASLVSEHVDEVLRLINTNRRVGAVWRGGGGPLLVRRLLYGPPPQEMLIPAAIDGCDTAALLDRFIPMLDRFAGPRLKADIVRFRRFAAVWPGSDLSRLDQAALELTAKP